MDKHADIIEDRIKGVVNDLTTYIDLRVSNRQHRRNKFKDDLGGGNMVLAISLFASLNLLGKCYACVTSTEQSDFDTTFDERGYARREDKVFVEFIEFVVSDIDGLFAGNPSKTGLNSVWEYFRDFATHVLVPDQGHSVLTYEWNPGIMQSAEITLVSIAKNEDVAFEKRKDSTWIVNVDKLLSLIPSVTDKTVHFLKEHASKCESECEANLQKVLWRHDKV